MQNALRFCLRFLIISYRVVLAPHMGGACRFEPSCSLYACECIEKHNPIFAVYLICRRLLRCRPGGEFGFDLVPEAKR